MAPRSALANISYTVDSDSEDEMARDTLPTPDSNAENKMAARKPHAKSAKATKSVPTTKPAAKSRTSTRQTSVGSPAGVKKPSAAAAKKTTAKRGRKALAEVEYAAPSDTEEVDDFDAESDVAPVEPPKAAKRGRPAKKAQDEVAEDAAPAKRTRKAAESAPEKKTTPKAKATAKPRPSKRAQQPEPEPDMAIPETQQNVDEPDPMDIEESIEMQEIPETMPPPPRPSARRAQPQSRTRQPSAGPRRAGSASDTERDPALRRKIGDITKRLDAMTTKYENLKEAASSQRESNFEQLRKSTEQAAKNQDAVIKALKQQISDIQSRTSEMTSMKKELAKLAKENERLALENSDLSASLEAAHKDSKTLSTKLQAARSAAPAESKNAPGSAVKPRAPGVVLPGAVEAAKESQLRQQRIDLYSDLTNLLIMSVKQGESGEDIYDCIQTGRNGTLHFQLSVANDPNNYDEAQFCYTPQLNEQRDAALLELLPDYLTEDIEFPRHQVAKFYEKISSSMSKKIEFED